MEKMCAILGVPMEFFCFVGHIAHRESRLALLCCALLSSFVSPVGETGC